MAIKKPQLVDQAGAKGHAAGTLFVAPDGSMLFLHRSPAEENYAGHWCLPGGKVDDGESILRGAEREAAEETGGTAPIGDRRLLDQRKTPNGMVFHTFAQAVDERFAPLLNDGEHTGYTWAMIDMLPKPMHPAVLKTIDERNVTDGEELAEWAAIDDPDDTAQDGVHAACNGRGCAGCGGSGISPTNDWPMKPGLGAMDAAFAALAADIAGIRGPELAFDRAPEGLEDLRRGVLVKLAFDRDTSQGRNVDGFERLHVKRAPITKAGINPYYGREIPKGNELGLDPGRVYRLLRHPDEIKKAASTFHNLPLLDRHVPHSADEHDGDITVGTVGSEAEYQHPYLFNSLAVWSRDGRDHVDSKKQKELSSAYSYDADMTPGTYEGEPYDGVMRNMVGNHVCLVKKGRAGSDVALDEALQPQQETMKMALKSMKATVAYGALTAFLRPRLAMDAAMPNIAGALGTFEPGKFKESTPNFIKALRKSLGKIKLAQDGDLVGVIEGVEKLMASIDGDKTVEDSDLERDPNELDSDDDIDGDDTSMDAGGPMEAVRAYLKEKGVPDDVIAGMPGMGEGDPDDEAAKAAALAKAGAKDGVVVEPEAGPDGKKKKPDFVSKGAMDAALKANTDATIARMNAVSAAKAHVQPIVGVLDMAFDSADGVYRQAFKMQDRDVSKIKELPALQALWDAIPAPGARQHATIAQDSATTSDFNSRFPNAAKVRKAG
jgi:8-oxo-dGTP pyrophosphatase MutT (NUDIX family)